MNTEYIELTELWRDGKYNEVAQTINNESWSNNQIMDFCCYFVKYFNREELEVLCKLV